MSLICTYEEILVKNQADELIGYLTLVETNSNDEFALLDCKGYIMTLASDILTLFNHIQKQELLRKYLFQINKLFYKN